MTEKKQEANDGSKPAAPARQVYKLRVGFETDSGNLRIEGDKAALEALRDACGKALKRWDEDASTMLTIYKKGGQALLFVVGIA